MSSYLSTNPGSSLETDTPYLEKTTLLSRSVPLPFLASAPALLMLALAAGSAGAPFSAESLPSSLITLRPDADFFAAGETPSTSVLKSMAQRGEWPASQTAIATVASTSAGNAIMARLAPMVTVRGKAPLAGEVSKVLVRAGQAVSVNDPILELSAGPNSRANQTDSRAERRQSAAESAQVRAAGEQAQLQQRMHAAQTQLVQAQRRVTTAQAGVDRARDIVRRLQRGEDVPRSADGLASENSAGPKTSNGQASASSRAQHRRNEVHAKAVSDAREAQRAANAATAAAESAERQAASQEAKAKQAEKAVADAQTALATAQKSFDAGSIKASALDAARAAVEEAEASVKSSASEAEKARQTAKAQRERARLAQSTARAADTGVVNSLKDKSVF